MKEIILYCVDRILIFLRYGFILCDDEYDMNNTATKEKRSSLPSLSEKELLVLEMLIEKDEMFGLEMVEASNEELKRGTIYITLGRMVEKGYVESREEPRIEPEIGIARRHYKATALGKRIFKSHEIALKYFNLEFG